MSEYRELPIERISEYKDPITLFKEDGVTFVEKGEGFNPMTIGWGGLGILWNRPCCTVYIHASRYSKTLFDKSDHFTICFFGKEHRDLIQYFGKASGRDEDKCLKSGIHMIKDGPYGYPEEAELVILCEKIGQSDFDVTKVGPKEVKSWYEKDGVHTIYQGRIFKLLWKKND